MGATKTLQSCRRSRRPIRTSEADSAGSASLDRSGRPLDDPEAFRTERNRLERRQSNRADSRRQRDSRPGTLLNTIFPNGIPACEDVIRAASSWLDEAERLARTR
jgi:hypothetical protein